MDAPVAYYPASWEIPLTREPRLCATRMLERQLDFMRSRGWPVEKPHLRVTRDRELVFRVHGISAYGVTFNVPDDGWHVILPAGAERDLCRQETRTRAGLLPDDVISIDTVFHELTHQFFDDEARTEYRALKLTDNFFKRLRSTRVRLGPAISWRVS
jgi:hypothetical protein